MCRRIQVHAKYKTLEKLVNKTQLPALVEQKPVPVSREAGDTRQVEEFHPLTLTAVVEETFLVVNYINDGKPSNPYVYKRPPPYIFIARQHANLSLSSFLFAQIVSMHKRQYSDIVCEQDIPGSYEH